MIKSCHLLDESSLKWFDAATDSENTKFPPLDSVITEFTDVKAFSRFHNRLPINYRRWKLEKLCCLRWDNASCDGNPNRSWLPTKPLETWVCGEKDVIRLCLYAIWKTVESLRMHLAWTEQTDSLSALAAETKQKESPIDTQSWNLNPK